MPNYIMGMGILVIAWNGIDYLPGFSQKLPCHPPTSRIAIPRRAGRVGVKNSPEISSGNVTLQAGLSSFKRESHAARGAFRLRAGVPRLKNIYKDSCGVYILREYSWRAARESPASRVRAILDERVPRSAFRVGAGGVL
jgi:hypothetical protein